MGNHLYRFDGKVFKQEDGGPIGDELAQAVARLVMIWWDGEFLKLCETVRLDIMFFLRYVDDTNKAVIPPPLGTRFQEGQFKVIPELVEEDQLKDRDKVVGELLRTMADSITPMLKFEEDVCSNHDDGKLPILDLKVWKTTSQENTIIFHEFYKKPMASRATLRSTTAYPMSQLKAIMTEEVLRRLRNCSPDSSWETKGKHLTEFALCLKSSGYSESFREMVFNKAVARYEKELENHQRGEADIYRSRSERLKQIEAKGGKATKDTWFRRKEGSGGDVVTSVLRVPYTQGNVLRKAAETILSNNAAPTGLKTKVQEGGGNKLEHSLIRSDPFPRERCHRDDCPVGGEDGCKDRCFQGHINYTIKCTRCEHSRLEQQQQQSASGDEGAAGASTGATVLPIFWYCGESSRGCYERFQQHIAQYKAGKNFMWQHVQEFHGGVMSDDPRQDFFMVQESLDPDPIRRILRESVRICHLRGQEPEGNNRKITLMNGKDEYFGVKVVQPTYTQE